MFNKRFKMILAAILISGSSFYMVGCNKDTSNEDKNPTTVSEDKDNAKEKDSESKDAKDNNTSASKKQKLIYYTYNLDTEKLTSHEREVKELTVDSIVKELIQAGVLQKDTKVKTFKVEEKNNVKTLVVDMSEDFINFNQGSSAELLQLQCFANSLIKSFNAKNVKLTVEGEPYSSGHIQMEEGDLLEFK